INVKDIGRALKIAVPYLLLQLISGKKHVGMIHQKFKKHIFLSCYRDLSSLSRDLSVHGIQFQLSYFQRRRRFLPAPADQRLKSCQKFVKFKRLDKIVICSCIQTDRKSTRLNSSHVSISYAVFCLKKKKEKKTRIRNRYTH